jgi:membrane associated rhomboid family serine protease
VLCVDCVRAAAPTAGAARARAAARSGRATVTIALIAMNVAFYVYGASSGVVAWQNAYGLDTDVGYSEPWRWVTSGFVHFGLLHIGLNMLMLYQFGQQLEAVLGSLRFAVLYGISMLGGSLAIMLLTSERSLHAGASGAVFGLFAAYGVILYTRKLAWQSLAASAGIWLVAGFIIPGISWQGHIGGAIAGAGAMLVRIAVEKNNRSKRVLKR